MERDGLLSDLLKRVSRSFYLSLAILPRSLRAPVGLAYLFARAADTIADTRLISREARLHHLEALRAELGDGSPSRLPEVIRACTGPNPHAAERELLRRLPDCFTRYGGSQYLNSSAVGMYEHYVVRELVGHMDATFRTIRHPAARAVMGKSSGGYGALVLGTRHPDVFGLVACHSGDMYFEYCYFPDIPKYLSALPRHGGSTRAFLKGCEKAKNKSRPELMMMINLVAMAACYAPNPRAALGFDLPFDEKTGELRPGIWRRMVRWDPVRMAERHRRNLKKLIFLFLDCGTRDEFQLHHGARILSRKFHDWGIRHVFEEFDDGHMNIAYRYDRSLELLSRRLARAR